MNSFGSERTYPMYLSRPIANQINDVHYLINGVHRNRPVMILLNLHCWNVRRVVCYPRAAMTTEQCLLPEVQRREPRPGQVVHKHTRLIVTNDNRLTL